MIESGGFDLFDRQALGLMAAVFHTIISFVSRTFGYLSMLHRLPFSSNMRDVPLSKDIRYPLANTSIRSTARHRETRRLPASAPPVFHVSHSFPFPEPGRGSHLS